MDYKQFQIPKLVIHDWPLEKLPEEAFPKIYPNYGDFLFHTEYLGEFIFKEPEMNLDGTPKRVEEKEKK